MEIFVFNYNNIEIEVLGSNANAYSILRYVGVMYWVVLSTVLSS